MQRSVSPYADKAVQNTSNQPLIHLPYCRDPSQPIKKLPAETTRHVSYSPRPYNRQSYGSIQTQAWNDTESYNRPAIYKKKHAPATPVNRNVPSPTPRKFNNTGEPESWQSPKNKVDKNKNIYGGSIPTGMNNPIKELEQLAKANAENANEDDPPFNFQAMLRKTPRNRASMKRNGESPLSIPIEPYSSSPVLNHGKGKAPPRPRSTQEFKRNDSVERFKLALKRADSSQLLTSLRNGNIEESVEIAPGIRIEGYVTDL